MPKIRITIDEHTRAQLGVIARRRANSTVNSENSTETPARIEPLCSEILAAALDEFGELKPLSVVHRRIDALAATHARQAEAVARLTEIAETLVAKLAELDTTVAAHRKEFATVHGETGVTYKTALAVKNLIHSLNAQGVGVSSQKTATKPAA
jgi:hypothetical protein